MDDLLQRFLSSLQEDSFTLNQFQVFCGCSEQEAQTTLEDAPNVSDQGNGYWEVVFDE